MNVVTLDTNIWVSALELSPERGTICAAFTKAVQDDVLATADELEAELIRVLTEKFGWVRDRVEAALTAALQRSIRVQLEGTVKVCRDPKDDMFLECCQRAGSDYLIAGDKDLLVLGQFGKTEIITAAEYVRSKH